MEIVTAMAGTNPYIKNPGGGLPKQKYRITYLVGETKEKIAVEVDPAKLPYDRTGQPGSLLEIALGHHVPIDHSCGGVCACSTCHVIVREGLESCSEAMNSIWWIRLAASPPNRGSAANASLTAHVNSSSKSPRGTGIWRARTISAIPTARKSVSSCPVFR